MLKLPEITRMALSATPWLYSVAAVMLLTGCSEMRILDQPVQVVEHDPREDIRLTSVETDITSAGLLTQRVYGRSAIFAQTRNILDINDMRIQTFDPETGTLEGETEAATGTVYLAAHPEVERNRSDMEFTGGVTYRAPAEENPAKDSLMLETDKLIYDNEAARFIGPSSHTIIMAPPGKTPITMRGSRLHASRDLTNISIQGGRMAPSQAQDAGSSYTEQRRELDKMAEQVRENSSSPPVRPTPLQVGTPPPPPERPPAPEIPPMAPRPTATPRP